MKLINYKKLPCYLLFTSFALCNVPIGNRYASIIYNIYDAFMKSELFIII